jgi:UDPglucose--hexose-1-phosphate uridylyltransferase
MGCSNPHPHGQIWAQESIPNGPAKEQINQRNYCKEHGTTLLNDYIKIEKEKNERIIFENGSFILLVPFWAFWPFETLIISKRTVSNILQFEEKEVKEFAEILKVITVKYDNIFNVSFPYSSGIHQSPTDGLVHDEWHFHMHFYPPLLRSATIKKYMVGYELLAEPQRDITPERSAEILKQAELIHYSLRNV